MVAVISPTAPTCYPTVIASHPTFRGTVPNMTPGGRGWPRHPVKELEAVLGEFYDAGWRIERLRKYYKAKCPCGDHMKMVHMSPSDPNYVKNMLMWLRRQTCQTSREETS